MSDFLSDLDSGAGTDESFRIPLEIIQKNMLFTASVLYRVSNVIENRLILEVVKTLDPEGRRPDLKEGRIIRLFLDSRDHQYLNEVKAFLTRKVSCANIPGTGCDIIGYVYLPEDLGGAYLFGGDFYGKEAAVKDYEVASIGIMCNFLSAILLKTRFKRQAEYDHLTGLFNSAKIKQKLAHIIKRFERKPSASACIALGDIDFFKSVNDTFGHIQGDLVLKTIGKMLSESLRGVFDVAGRYGGEEFLLIFDETDENDTVRIVERLRKLIARTPFQKVDKDGKWVDNDHLNITLSFGVCAFSPDIQTESDWIARADVALYESKKTGRNKTSVFKDEET